MNYSINLVPNILKHLTCDSCSQANKVDALKNSTRLRRLSRHSYDSYGVSLIEVVMAIAISMIAIFTAAVLISAVGKNLKSTESTYDTQNAIDKNIAAIESAADRYVCGENTCSVEVNGSIPIANDYINPANATAWSNFKTRCFQSNPSLQSDLIYPLKTYIETESAYNVDPGIFRSITVHGNEAQNLTYIRHMTVQYRAGNSAGKILRDVTIMPTIVAYCP